jgi:hypothetical protein
MRLKGLPVAALILVLGVDFFRQMEGTDVCRGSAQLK